MQEHDSSRRFETLVFHLVTRPDSLARVEETSDDLAVLSFTSPRALAVVVRWRPDRDKELPARLERLVRMAYKRSRHEVRKLEVALVGGPPDARAMVSRLRPSPLAFSIRLHHLDDRGERWCNKKDVERTQLGRLLGELPGLEPPSPADLPALEARIARDQAEVAGQNRELVAFAQVMRATRPIATYTLAAVIALVFVLETLFGGADNPLTLIDMGALVPEAVRDGEIWRLLSCTFLHAGFTHIACNGFVLLALGISLERILGTRRFLVLYGGAALAGSVASSLFSQADLSVGASGALWGVLAAQSALAFRPRGLLPRVMVARLERAAAINLVLNLSISFHPRVDMAAHLGGGIVGALLLASGLLTRGLRPLDKTLQKQGTPERPDDQPEATAASPSPSSPVAESAYAEPRWLLPAATIMTSVLAASLILGLVMGRAWSLRGNPELVTQDVPALGIRIALPERIATRGTTETEPAITRVLFGQMRRDPVIVEIARVALPDSAAGTVTDELLDSIGQQLAQGFGDGIQPDPPRRIQAGDRPAVHVAATLSSELELERVAILFPGWVLRIDTFLWSGFGSGYRELALPIAESVSPLPEQRSWGAQPADRGRESPQ